LQRWDGSKIYFKINADAIKIAPEIKMSLIL
jgi:hypothetical protein